MKTTLIFPVFFLAAPASFSQAPKDPQNIRIVTDREPAYPGGDQALYDYVFHHVKYSEEAKAKHIEGEVLLSFDVLADSTVTDLQVLKAAGYGIDEEVKRIVKQLKFIPAVQNGTRVRMNMMVTFPVRAH